MTPTQFRNHLEALHWTQRGLADLLGLSHNTVHRWALGESRVPETVARFLDKSHTAVIDAYNEIREQE